MNLGQICFLKKKNLENNFVELKETNKPVS